MGTVDVYVKVQSQNSPEKIEEICDKF